MQITLLSSAENKTGYQADQLGDKAVEDWRLGSRWKIRFGWTLRHGRGPDLGPSCQATAHEDAAAFGVFSSSVRLDHLLAQSFVGFDASLRKGRSYAGWRGFFLLAKARSRLRR
jgi:hypothetical protein